MLRITAHGETFRRCNTEFTNAGKDFADDHFTKKELKILVEEPMLTVQPMPDSDAIKAAKKNSNGSKAKTGSKTKKKD